MKKPNLPALAKSLSLSVRKHSPEILTGIGIAGMITTVIMAVRATPKAMNLIENRKKELNDQLVEDAKSKNLDKVVRVDKLKPMEVVQAAWKPYVPAVVTGTLSVACLIGASSVNLKRNAALATAYTLSESALKEYREKVVKTIGEKKEQAVRDAVAKEKLEKDPMTNREVIFTGNGDTLCYDSISGRYFKSSIEKIKQAVNELNRTMIEEMYIPLNDFYYEIGLENIDIGDDLGWNLNNGLIDPSFSSQLASDGTPCLVVSYHVEPRWDFRQLI